MPEKSPKSALVEALVIRSFRPEDLKAIKELHVTALEAIGAFHEDPQHDRDLDDIEGTYFSGGGTFVVGELGGAVVAMGALQRLSPDKAEIKRMRVAPALQMKGIGRKLLEALERRALQAGVRTLTLDTTTKQVAAGHLYEKAGYREVGRRKLGPWTLRLFEKEL